MIEFVVTGLHSAQIPDKATTEVSCVKGDVIKLKH